MMGTSEPDNKIKSHESTKMKNEMFALQEGNQM